MKCLLIRLGQRFTTAKRELAENCMETAPKVPMYPQPALHRTLRFP